MVVPVSVGTAAYLLLQQQEWLQVPKVSSLLYLLKNKRP
jgi:hypothetical protein